MLVQCYCGNDISSAQIAPDTDCNMACTGDATIECGGSWRLSIYAAVAQSATSASPISTTSLISAMPVTSVVSITSTTAPLPTVTAGLTYAGCYVDSSSRTLSFFAFSSTTNMTTSSCQIACSGAGYTYAGVEYGQEVSTL
jgi:hypothetical protein